MAFHIPVALGVVFGKERPFALGFRYLVVPQARKEAGALGVTLSFPVERSARPKRKPLKPLRLRHKPVAS